MSNFGNCISDPIFMGTTQVEYVLVEGWWL
jgi:hypothetical protein